MSDREIIEIVQAHIDGKPIEICTKGQGKDEKWYDIVNPKWDFQHCDYRVKQEPRTPREFWIKTSRPSDPEFIRVREVLE